MISERAGRCYLALGLEQAGRRLLEQAHQRYEAWGASRKTAALIEEFPFLRPNIESTTELTALLQAGQQLGRQRTVPELAQATAEMIADLSGASDVQIVVLDSEGQWQIKGGLSPNGPLQPQNLERADNQGLLPASALHVSLQVLHPLVLPDALLDPRVSGDRFFEPMSCCSLLVVPVLVQQRPIAVLMAAHRQQRGAFVTGLTRPVELLCGQLAVALESLLIQESLEQQVRERSQALEQAYAREVLNEERRRQLLEQKLKTSLTAAAVTHEIQQPLAAILLRCGLAQQHLAALPARTGATALEQVLFALSADAKQVVSTMERMRMLLRNVETAHSSVDLAASLQSALIFLRSEIEAQNVLISHEGLDDPCPLQGDATQLQTAAVNLIRNAIQAMEAQPAASRRLLLRLQRQSDQARLVVADSGPGFPAGFDHETRWEVLKSTKANGMGLGLFLAQTAVSNHHGQLHIGRGDELGGAEVVIELPLSAPSR